MDCAERKSKPRHYLKLMVKIFFCIYIWNHLKLVFPKQQLLMKLVVDACIILIIIVVRWNVTVVRFLPDCEDRCFVLGNENLFSSLPLK